MSTDFRSEMFAWREVFVSRKKTLLFFFVLLFVLTISFFLSVWQMKIFSAQIQQLTGEVQLIAEISDGLPDEQRVLLQKSLQALPGVQDVEFRDKKSVLSYIDQHLFSGYQEFLQKYQLEVPVNSLFLIHLSDISDRNIVIDLLKNRFPSQLIVSDTSSLEKNDSFSFQFIDRLRSLHFLFRILLLLSLLSVFFVSAYLTAFVLSERSRGFHLTQLLHLSVPYKFFPAFCMSFLLSLSVVLLSSFIVFLSIGEFLFSLSVMLFLAFVVLNIILIWFGRLFGNFKF